jgi:hypothetical protein
LPFIFLGKKIILNLKIHLPNLSQIPLETQESKNLEISFENFQKMLDGSKFVKRCLLGISIQNRFEKYQIFFKKILIFS